MPNTIRTDAIQHGADCFFPFQQCLRQANAALAESIGMPTLDHPIFFSA